jgi:hypothetical protein
MTSKKSFGLRPAIGLIMDSQRIALSVVASTARGRREVHRDLRPCGDDGPYPVLWDMLKPWLDGSRSKRGRTPWIQVGLPESRIFQATVPVTASNRLHSPQNFFLEAVQTTNLRAEDRIIDLVKFEINKQPFASLAACPCGLVADQVEILERLNLRIAVMEPAPSGLLRAGEHWARTPRTSKLSLRIFLGRKSGLGMLVAHGHPLFWHGFELTQGDETKAVMGSYSTLWMMGRHGRITAPIDTVTIHGRRDLTLSVDPGAFRERTGARLVRAPEPDYDLGAAAFGIALNNPLLQPTALDLGRAVKSPPSVGDIIPWGEILVQGLMVAGVSLFLTATNMDMETRFNSVRSQTKVFPWLGEQGQVKLDEQKKQLEERIKLVDSFMKSRVSWSSQLRTIAIDTPETTVITSLAGEGPMQGAGKPSGQAKKQMIVNFATPLAKDGSIPGEVNELIARLRSEPAILRQFSSIEVSGLRSSESTARGKEVTYSVVCLPGAETAKKSGAK